jgi:hypothetical protein
MPAARPVVLVVLALAVVFVSFVPPGPAIAQDCVDYGDHLRWLANVALPGQLMALVPDGDVLHVASRTQDGSDDQLLALDISAPGAPVVLDTLELPDPPVAMTRQGDVLYVGCGSAGGALVLVDASDPTDLQLLGTVGMYAVTDVLVEGGLAYFTNGYAPTFIADVSDPTAPELLSWPSTGGIGAGVGLHGDALYVADAGAGLVVVDVSDPTAPVIVTTLPTAGEASDVAVIGDQAYVCLGEAGVQVYDASDPWQPMAGASVPTNHLARRIRVVGDQALVVDRNTGVVVLDVSDPAAPAVLGTVDSHSYVNDVAVVGGHAYLAAYANDLVVLAYPGPGPVAPLGGSITHYHDVVDLVLVDGLAVQLAANATNFDGLQVLDLADPTQPTVIGALDHTHHGERLVAHGSRVYTKSHTYFDVVDLSDPTQPDHVARLPLWGSVFQMERSGDLVFVAAGEEGVQLIDVSDPLAPYLRNTLPTSEPVHGVAVHDAMLYVGDGPSLEIWVVADPDAPVLVSTVPLPDDALHLDVDGGYVHAALGYQAAIVDVTPPSTPALVSTFGLQAHTNNLRAHGDLLYVADADVGFQVFDVSDRTAPLHLGSCDTPSMVRRLVVAGDVLGAAVGITYGGDPCPDGGLLLFPRQCPAVVAAPDHGDGLADAAASSALRAFPNPFNPRTTVAFTLPRAGRARLAVYDLAGRRLAELVDGSFAAGRHAATWDGRDGRGREAPSGTYLVHGSVGGEAVRARVMLVR